MDYRLPGSSVHGDALGKNTGVGCRAMPPRGSSQPRDWTQVSHIAGILHHLSHQGSLHACIFLFCSSLHHPIKMWTATRWGISQKGSTLQYSWSPHSPESSLTRWCQTLLMGTREEMKRKMCPLKSQRGIQSWKRTRAPDGTPGNSQGLGRMTLGIPLQVGSKLLGFQHQQRLGWELDFPKFKGRSVLRNKQGCGNLMP